jgi:hypothetical protein
MAADPRITNAVASAACDAIVDAIDGGAGAGLLRIYDGTIPTNADTALGAQVLLAELTFSDPAFGAASNGVATASAITSDSSANATGTASWFRIVSSTPTTIMDGTVGTSGEDLNLNTTSIVSGATVSVTAFTVTVPKT